MDPITIGILIAVAAASALGAGAYNWDKIIKAIKGKEFAFLGDREVGKSSLITFLRTGNVLTEYRASLAPDRFKVKLSSISSNNAHDEKETFEIVIRNGVDFGGLRSAYPYWKKAVGTADIVVYLFRVDYVMQGNKEHLQRIEDDASQIGRWISEQPKKPDVYFVGGFCDLEKSIKFEKNGSAVNYQYDNIAKYIQVLSKAICAAGANTQIVVGSLKTNEGARGIVSQLFKLISNR